MTRYNAWNMPSAARILLAIALLVAAAAPAHVPADDLAFGALVRKAI